MKTTGEKEYAAPDPFRSVTSRDLWGDVKDCLSPEIVEEARKLVAGMTFSRMLTAMRVKSGISQRMMAAALDCSQPRVCAIESTPNERISMATILKYCEVTGLPFKAELENGRIVSISRPRRKKEKNGKKPGSTRSAATA